MVKINSRVGLRSPSAAGVVQDGVMKRVLAAGILVVLCIAVLVQYRTMRKLKAEGVALRALADARAMAEAQHARAGGAPGDDERERSEQAELNRLRGQVAE